MDNVVLTSASQISPNSGNPLNPLPIPSLALEPETATTTTTIEELVTNPLAPTEQNQVDGNFQARMDVNYQAHDVALATATKANGHEQTNGFKLGDHHQMEIDDGYEHPDKATSCCSMLNKLFLALAIVCFALFLCSIAFIIANIEGAIIYMYTVNTKAISQGQTYFVIRLNGKHAGRNLARILYPSPIGDPFTPLDNLLNDPYFNLTHPNPGGLVVVLSRHGASITDILIPYTDNQGIKQYRSIVLKSNNGNSFGSIRFGFDEEVNSINMTNQLPSNYPFFNFYNENWSMYGDPTKPYRVRFVNGLIEVIYEFSSSNYNELMMTTIVTAPLNEQIIVDPTNNIYFNLRGYGNLSTHYLNISLSTPINIKTNEFMQQNPLVQGESVNQLTNVNQYFYKLNRAGIGKNYIATLSERETKTTMNIFADHAGLIIDPFGIGLSNRNKITSDMYGIRLSPKQSPVYQLMSIYGPTLVVYPSQGIHTTWWQFEY